MSQSLKYGKKLNACHCLYDTCFKRWKYSTYSQMKQNVRTLKLRLPMTSDLVELHTMYQFYFWQFLDNQDFPPIMWNKILIHEAP